MATSGTHSESDGEDINVENAKEWPLTYEGERKEYICGCCGQALLVNHTADDLETHFKSCKNSKQNGLSLIFEELRKLNTKFDVLNADVQAKVDKLKTEVKDEIKIEIFNVKTEFGKELENKKAEFNTVILGLKSDIEKQLETKNEGARDEVLPTLFWKIKALEEGVKEKMAEINGRVSGVTETISTAVRTILEAKGTSSAETVLINELDRSKKESEAIWVKLRESERDVKTIKIGLDGEIAQLKTEAETFSEQLKTKDREFQVLKTQLEDKKAKNISSKKMSFHVEPSLRDPFAIPMNAVNLVTHTYLFQPSFKWTIGEIETITAQKTFDMSSQMFQWNGYPVQARVKLELKEDGYIYMSLRLTNVTKDDINLKDFKPIPQVFYLLKDRLARNPRQLCRAADYHSGVKFSYSLEFKQCFVPKPWFNHLIYNVDDSVDIEIYVEPSPMAQLVHSYDGTLEWNIEDYSRRLQLEKDWLVLYHESPYFYTSPRGFRVQVGMHLKGGPTAVISFLTGMFDAELPETFPHSTTVTLVNRKDPERSIEKTIVKDIQNKTEYIFEMCKVEEVADLIENDALLCKVTIKSQ